MKKLITLFNNTSIRYKIWLGFGSVLVIFLLQGLSSLNGLSNVHSKFVDVAEEVQPAALLSMELETAMDSVSNLLSQFLLTKDQERKEEYLKESEDLRVIVKKLRELSVIKADSEAKELVSGIATGIDVLTGYSKRMIELAENDNKNIAAIGYASEKVNPLNRAMIQYTNQMLQSEEEEGFEEERAELHQMINDLRYNWSTIINEMRLYLAFKAPAALDNISLYKEKVEILLEKILKNEDLFTIEEEDSIPKFIEHKTRFFERWSELVSIHGGERWRMDTYLMKKEIGPLLDEIKKSLKRLVEIQNTNTINANREVNEIYGDSKLLFFVIATFLCFFVGFIAYMLSRNITIPLSNAVSVANSISGGTLDNEITVRTNDETGQLLTALSGMQSELNRNIVTEREAAAITMRIKTALDTVSASVLLVNNAGIVIYSNAAVISMFKNVSQVLSENLDSFDIDKLEGMDIEEILCKDKSWSRQLFEELDTSYESEFSIADITFQVIANPVLSTQGERLGTVVEWHDVTEELKVQADVARVVGGAKAGDFTRSIDTEGLEGFMLNLSEGINEVVANNAESLKEVTGLLSAMSSGDLSKQISGNYEGVFDKLKNDANATVQQLTSIISEISESADKVNNASDEISSGNAQLRSRTEQQAAALENTASSMEEIMTTVSQNAENTSDANTLVSNAKNEAEKGSEVVANTIRAMAEINDSSKKVSDIISVIEEIAFQTNLLALNAAVEAARAGEQGRGFAVVASEVRSLAQRSSEAAKEIKDLISNSVTVAERGSVLVDECGQTIESMVRSVDSVSSIVAEISQASVEQTKGISLINKAINDIDSMTQKNSELVNAAATSSRTMVDQAQVLHKLVGYFRY